MQMFKKIFFSLFLTLTLASAGVITVQAATDLAAPAPETRIAGPLGLFTGVSDACYATGDCTLCDIVAIVNSVIKLALGIVGTVALAAFIWAGINILMAKSRISYFTKAKDIIKYAIIGLLLVFFSFAMVNFGLNILVGSSLAPKDASIYSSPAKLFNGQAWTDICAGVKK